VTSWEESVGPGERASSLGSDGGWRQGRRASDG
jgi:hypothetical protein